MAQNKVLLEASRATALAAHNAAGLCTAAQVGRAARLLRVAEAMARAAVAMLSGKDFGGGVQVASDGGGALRAPSASGVGASRSARRRARARAAAASVKAAERKEEGNEADNKMDQGRGDGVGLPVHAAPIPLDVDAYMEGSELQALAAGDVQAGPSVQAPTDLPSLLVRAAEHGPEAEALLAQILGIMGTGILPVTGKGSGIVKAKAKSKSAAT